MPTKFKDVQEFFDRIAHLEERVEGLLIENGKLRTIVDNLMDWQRWQMGILAVILIAAVKVIVGK